MRKSQEIAESVRKQITEIDMDRVNKYITILGREDTLKSIEESRKECDRMAELIDRVADGCDSEIAILTDKSRQKCYAQELKKLFYMETSIKFADTGKLL